MKTKFEALLDVCEASAKARLRKVIVMLRGFSIELVMNDASHHGVAYALWGYWECKYECGITVRLTVNRRALKTFFVIELGIDQEHHITLSFESPYESSGRMVTNCPRDRLPSRLRHLFLAAGVGASDADHLGRRVMDRPGVSGYDASPDRSAGSRSHRALAPRPLSRRR